MMKMARVEQNQDLSRNTDTNAITSSKKSFEEWKAKKDQRNMYQILQEFIEEQKRYNVEILERLDRIDRRLSEET